MILDKVFDNRFKAMTGAKINFNGDNANILFNGYKESNLLLVTYNKNTDTFDMTFSLLRKCNLKHVKTFSDVQISNIKEIFTEFTGLDTHL